MSRTVRVSPKHHVMLDDDYVAMIDRAPSRDFVVRTLAKRMAGTRPLMTGELVIAGVDTRETHPAAVDYPLHFRKTYYPGRLHGDPRVEFEHHTLASTLVDVPAPIGCTRNTYRSCLLPGTPLDRLSPLGAEPDESNIETARALPSLSAIGLWNLLDEAFDCLLRMQAGGLTHGDAHLHNFVACTSPIEVLPVDFEIAATRNALEPRAWDERCQKDRDHLLKVGVFLQCALGQQRGALGRESVARLEGLVRRAEPFRRAIAERTLGRTFT